MAWNRSQDDRKGLEIDHGRFEGVSPWFHGSVEDGPRLQHVVAFKTDATQFASCTVEAVATHYPTSLYLVGIAIVLDVRHDAVVRIDGQPDQAGGSIDLATVLMERAGEDGLCGLLGEADIERVNAAAASQVYGPEELSAGMKLDHPLSASGIEKFFDQSHGFEYLQGTRVNDGRSIPVEGRGLGIDQLAWDPSSV
jgi:hypothetical protein